MLDEREETQLWRTISRMDRAGRRRLIEKIERSIDTDSGATIDPARRKQIKAAFARMAELRKGVRLGDDVTIRQLIEEGRRY